MDDKEFMESSTLSVHLSLNNRDSRTGSELAWSAFTAYLNGNRNLTNSSYILEIFNVFREDILTNVLAFDTFLNLASK